MPDKNKNTIRLLHLSDFHVESTRNDELEQRIKALVNDLSKNFNDIDYVVISGDLVQSGKPEQFTQFHDLVIEKIKSQVHIGLKRFIIVPGNHDVDRSKVSDAIKSGLSHEIKTTESANKYIKGDTDNGLNALDNFFTYIDTHFCQVRQKRPFYSITKDHADHRIGFACLNTAWRCLGDDTKGKVFLSSEQTSFLQKQVDPCTVKIALMHHDFTWLHPDEITNCIDSDIKRDYHVIILGHSHEENSVREQTTSSDTVLMTGVAFFDGTTNGHHGYNVYDIDLNTLKLTAYYRKFIRTRREFDKNVDHATDGEKEFSLNISLPVMATQKYDIKPLGLPAVENNMNLQLRKLQGIDNPIFVPPQLAEVVIVDGERQLKNCDSNYFIELLNKTIFLFAPPEYGKTIFLENLALHSQNQKTFVYIDFRDDAIKGRKPERIIADKAKEFQDTVSDVSNLCFILDHLKILSSDDLFQILETFYSNGLNFIIPISNKFLFDQMCNAPTWETAVKMELKEWDILTVINFAKQYLHAKSIDDDNVISALRYNLEHCDLPLTPVIISMYVSLFSLNDENVKGISLTSLIERIEKIKLSCDDFNLINILIELAIKMLNEKTRSIKDADFRAMIAIYFSSKNLPCDVEKTQDILIESGFIKTDGDQILFSYYIFLDFYIAKAIYQGKLKLTDFTQNIDCFIKNSEALSLYGALARDNATLLEDLYFQILDTFSEFDKKNFSLKYLDGFIEHLLLPKYESDEDADRIAQHDLEQRRSFHEIEDEFQERRILHTEQRSQQNSLDTSDVFFISKLIMLLKLFYNLFRNLENIDGKKKEDFLDLILEYHIYCNFMLISFFHKITPDKEFQSITAYLATMGGQTFLKNEMWSPNLRITIENSIKNTTNDFKHYLLISLYFDGKFKNYSTLLTQFLDSTESHAAIEMLYCRIREFMIDYESKEIPTTLITVFKRVYDKRKKYCHIKSTSVTNEIGIVKRAHSKKYMWKKNMEKPT